MRHRPLFSLALILVVSGFTACSGGGGGGGVAGVPGCDGAAAKALCLTACNLGCTTTGCELTEIAQNQPLVFTFSQNIDLRSVSTSSISLKTAQGEEPVGRYIVNGNTITFQPEVRTVGGATFFGFDPGAKYTLQLPGGPNNINSLVSTSGDRLAESFNCTISVSLGILDLDGLSPRALLIEPRVRDDVDRDLLIRMEFTEIIDIGPFFGTNASTGPIRFLIRRLRPVIDPLTGMPVLDSKGEPVLECNPDATSTPLFGAPRVELDSVRGVTVVTYRAPQPLPGDKCVEIVVTDRVKDLSGNPARLQVFRLTTEFNQISQVDAVEDFKDETNLDRDLSAGTWGDAVDPDGEGTFASIGGDGAHGEFSLRLATAVANEDIGGVRFTVFEMDTENTVIPGSNTFDGRTVVVRDGVYRFSKFFLPPETKLRFVGSHAPQFHVRGLIDIRGIIDVRGEDVPVSSATGTPETGPMISENEIGQAGAPGGPGGGDGGAGGDKPDGLGFQARFDGQDGGNGSVIAGHAYAVAAQNTGGKGSPMVPSDGLGGSVIFTGFIQSGQLAAGGGGGGHASPGQNGRVVMPLSPSAPADIGPDGEGGGGLPALLPVPPGSLSHEHFLIGGGGGGGGGGTPFFSFRFPIAWRSGAAGAGGAGALLLRAGHRLAMNPDSQIIAIGGSGGVYRPSVGFAPPAPGGAGAGGSIVLQCANEDEVVLSGFMDVRGGIGSTVESTRFRLAGGNGADGLIRLETPSPIPALGSVEPAVGQDRTGELVTIDNTVGFQSRWIDSGELFPPDFVNYVLDVEIDGVPVTYSDDQTLVPNSRLAGPGEPVVFRIQGAILDLFTGEPDPLTIRPWRFYVGEQGTASGQLGLINDAPTGYRFLIILDRTVMGPGVEVKIKKLTIRFQTS